MTTRKILRHRSTERDGSVCAGRGHANVACNFSFLLGKSGAWSKIFRGRCAVSFVVCCSLLLR